MVWLNPLNPIIPDSVYQLDYRPYRRQFLMPLRTRYGEWKDRQGLILKISDQQGRVGFGEIAPLPWFGSETMEQVLEWCASYGAAPAHPHISALTIRDILAIPNSYPACQFGVESAILSLAFSGEEQSDMTIHSASNVALPHFAPHIPNCHLLPTGAIALTAWQQPWQNGTRTFKWKIGVATVAEELSLLDQLVRTLPPSAILRLDANGGLEWHQACQWLECCDRLSSSPQPCATIEFLEQPLPPSEFDALLALSHRFQTAIALDESVATLGQLKQCHTNGWRGIVVIKAAIAGFPSHLRQFCQNNAIDVVWSSVFETAIARQFIGNYLIESPSFSPRAVGFGINQWFIPSALDDYNTENIWMSLIK